VIYLTRLAVEQVKKGLLVHPTDKEITVWHDPYSHELRLARKLAESIRRQVKAQAR